MATQDDEAKPKLEFIDDPAGLELYVDDATGFGLLNGTVAITLEALRWDHSQENMLPRRVVVAHLRMSIPAAQGLAVGLFDFMAQRGLNPTRKPPDEPVQ